MKLPFSVIALMIAGASLCLTACGGDDPDEPSPAPTPSGPNVQPDPVTPVPDPAGTVEVNMPNNGTKVYLPEMGDISIDAGNNFVCGGFLDIISVDAVSSLGNITSVPNTGFSSSVAVKPGNGYIVRYRTGASYINDKINYQIVRYARLYVVDNLVSVGGGLAGAVVKYQANWNDPLEIPIKFVENNVTVSYYYRSSYYGWQLSQTHFLFEKAVKCTVKDAPEWLHVTAFDGFIDIYCNSEPQESADIVLTNDHGDATLHLIFQPK